MNKVFIDSNIILYLFDYDSLKKKKAESLVQSNPNVNSQVLAEVGNVCLRKFSFSKQLVLNIWTDLLQSCGCLSIDTETIIQAIDLSGKYDFQLFDAIIISRALQHNCSVIYSEDFQHNQIIENKLQIVNPFV